MTTNGCIENKDLRELGESAVADYDRRIAGIPADLSAPFNMEAMRLQDELLRLYKLVVMCVRSEPNVESVASLWSVVVDVCDVSADRLSKLKIAHPASAAEIYYDKILDLRNKCRRLQEMHR
jgi:hypothetical protein